MLRILPIALACCAVLPASVRAEELDVTQRNKTFLPGEVNLKVGDTIVFHNEDKIIHNMFSRSENFEFNLKLQKPGQDLRQSFDAPGTALVRCAIHPKMKLVVKVEE